MKHFLLVLSVSLLAACTSKVEETGNVAPPAVSIKEPLTLDSLLQLYRADVGIAGVVVETGDRFGFNQEEMFPMQSVYKLHLSIAVLKAAEEGKINIDSVQNIPVSFYLPNTHSPLRDENPTGAKKTVKELIEYSVSHSDNIACDWLFALAGGPDSVNATMKRLGIVDVHIENTEREMQAEWRKQYKNYTTPPAAVDMLVKLQSGKLLNASNTALLLEAMKNTTTSRKRIRGLLPEGTMVANKTGTSGKKDGITAAVNDIGIITLPDGRHLAIAVFVGNSRENDETNERIIAEVARAGWQWAGGR